MIRTEDILEVRNRTGAGLINSKKALSAVDGDIEKAVEYLRTYNPHVMVYHPPIVDEDMKSDK